MQHGISNRLYEYTGLYIPQSRDIISNCWGMEGSYGWQQKALKFFDVKKKKKKEESTGKYCSGSVIFKSCRNIHKVI